MDWLISHIKAFLARMGWGEQPVETLDVYIVTIGANNFRELEVAGIEQMTRAGAALFEGLGIGPAVVATNRDITKLYGDCYPQASNIVAAGMHLKSTVESSPYELGVDPVATSLDLQALTLLRREIRPDFDDNPAVVIVMPPERIDVLDEIYGTTQGHPLDATPGQLFRMRVEFDPRDGAIRQWTFSRSPSRDA